MAKVVIVGAGKVGRYLASVLTQRGYNIVMIESNPVTAEKVANELGIEMLCGDGSVSEIVRQVSRDADVFVAVTGKDEVNCISCQLAKEKYNVRFTIARINNPKNSDITSYFGIDKSFCGTDVFVDLVENEIVMEGLRIINRISGTKHVIVEFVLSENSNACGKTLMEYRFPGKSKVVVIKNAQGEADTPRGDTVMHAGDDMYMVCSESEVRTVWKDMVVGNAGKN